ncbi:MAG: type IV toxin-antitoxin system AbiEi family antitoxin domain-containing protein, partial [Solirubrobacteraceae bacterium]
MEGAGLQFSELVRQQHGVIARRQLLELGYGPKAIEHRIASRRLLVVRRGVYAVGRPQITRHGVWMAAALACGPGALLSHWSAGALWAVLPCLEPALLHVSVPANVYRRVPGVVVHRRVGRGEETAHPESSHGADATSPPPNPPPPL